MTFGQSFGNRGVNITGMGVSIAGIRNAYTAVY
jgi:hypothetical protein